MIPTYAGIEELRQQGDSFQYGGRWLCEGWNFDTEDGRAHFTTVPIPQPSAENGDFAVSTRRGKQFNSMVQETRDAITGAVRDAVLINEHDAARLGVAQGDAVLLRSPHGELRCRAHMAPIAPGNLQVHWPEGNVLIDAGRRSPEAVIPDYNARVTVTPVE